ncbi:Dihydroxyacetone kinase [Kluyvera intermedia]|nr:Dihydroxyacetone kinase [Kluyvera intermedia]
MSQFFYNQRENLINDAIEGAIIASPWNNLARLETDPAIRIVVRQDLDKSRVAVISGRRRRPRTGPRRLCRKRHVNGGRLWRFVCLPERRCRTDRDCGGHPARRAVCSSLKTIRVTD